MKLYRVEAPFCGYDEYDSFIVWAETKDEAIALATKEAKKHYGENFNSGVTAEEVKPTKKASIIIGSFNAG